MVPTCFMCILVVFSGALCSKIHKCPTRTNAVAMDDVQLALRVSTYAYEDLEVGDKIPGTSLKVTFVFEDKYTNNVNDPGFKVYIMEHGNVTYVAYRGTDTNDQLLQQAISQLMSLHGVPYTIAGEKVNVNQFFLSAFRLLQMKLRPRLKDVSRKYILTGHSLGGAMASLLAIEMTQQYDGSIWKHPQSSLITFGQPRVGNKAYADLHDRLISPWRKLRFILNMDPVPRIPFGPDFVHHSREIYLAHRQEWRWSYPWLKYSKFWRVCREQEDPNCSMQFAIAWQVQDHMLASYSEIILQPPNIYESVDKKEESSFREAFVLSC